MKLIQLQWTFRTAEWPASWLPSGCADYCDFHTQTSHQSLWTSWDEALLLVGQNYLLCSKWNPKGQSVIEVERSTDVFVCKMWAPSALILNLACGRLRIAIMYPKSTYYSCWLHSLATITCLCGCTRDQSTYQRSDERSKTNHIPSTHCSFSCIAPTRRRLYSTEFI